LDAMETSSRWSRMDEPFRLTLARNVAICVVVGVLVSLLRHDFRLFLPVAVLALWPSLGGHFIELAFLNVLRPRISQGRLTQAVVRMLVWAASGVLLYLCMAATARLLAIEILPLDLWWCGCVLFIGIEIAVHAVLAIRGLSSFYDGRG
jgi:hypothetical protein